MVRETGLEPVRDYHTPLKRARLPIPPLSRLFLGEERDKLYHPKGQLSRPFFAFFKKFYSVSDRKYFSAEYRLFCFVLAAMLRIRVSFPTRINSFFARVMPV